MGPEWSWQDRHSTPNCNASFDAWYLCDVDLLRYFPYWLPAVTWTRQDALLSAATV
jgi:hypothetical protein